MPADASLETLLSEAARLRRAGRVGEAITAYRALLARWPALADSWYNLGLLLRRAGQPMEALDAYRRALDHGIDRPEEVHLNRAVILAEDLRRPADAEAELARALTINPAYDPALLNLGNLLEDVGRRDEAAAGYQALLDRRPGNPDALARLAGVVRPSGPDDPLIGALRQALQRPDLSAADRAALGFALGRLLDATGAYDEAFVACGEANRQSRASAGPGRALYDPAAQVRLVDQLIAIFDRPEPFAPSTVGRARPPPIFIVGMFRSGSTLVEQVLASHRRVTSGGELDLLPGLVRRKVSPWPVMARHLAPADAATLGRNYLDALAARFPGADVLTDKRPDNLAHVGLIKRMFPDARIIHTRRDPLDNALSLYFLHLDHSMAYALDLADTAHFMSEQQRLADHWKRLYGDQILNFDYDAFVRDPRPMTEQLLAFCGLPWDEACMAFHKADSMVRTASVWQVREPLYQRASGRWRHYARHLEPVRERLERLAALPGEGS